MRTVIDMAREVGIDWHKHWNDDESNRLEQFAELVRADERNATLDEIAAKIEAMLFGDTAASFAVWIREQKQ